MLASSQMLRPISSAEACRLITSNCTEPQDLHLAVTLTVPAPAHSEEAASRSCTHPGSLQLHWPDEDLFQLFMEKEAPPRSIDSKRGFQERRELQARAAHVQEPPGGQSIWENLAFLHCHDVTRIRSYHVCTAAPQGKSSACGVTPGKDQENIDPLIHA